MGGRARAAIIGYADNYMAGYPDLGSRERSPSPSTSASMKPVSLVVRSYCSVNGRYE